MMPKRIERPRSSLKNCLSLASTVYDLGGVCSEEICAEKLGKKISGAFRARLFTTVKYGFVSYKKGQIAITDLFRKYKLSYDEKEAQQILTDAFFKIELFNKIYERFRNIKLPIDFLEKMLQREFDVEANVADKVAGYFIDAAKEIGLLNPDFTFNQIATINTQSSDSPLGDENDPESEDSNQNENSNGISESNSTNFSVNKDCYSVRIKGPGMDTVLEVNNEDDLLILNAIIGKIKRNLSTN
jgi:hypothetical protein